MLLLNCKNLSLWACLSRHIISSQKMGYSYFHSVQFSGQHTHTSGPKLSCFKSLAFKGEAWGFFKTVTSPLGTGMGAKWDGAQGWGQKRLCFPRASLFLLTLVQLHILSFQWLDHYILGLVRTVDLRSSFFPWFSSLLISQWHGCVSIWPIEKSRNNAYNHAPTCCETFSCSCEVWKH